MVKKVELIANLAIIVAATLLCVVLLKDYFIKKAQPIDAASVTGSDKSDRRPPVNAQIQPGTKLSLTGIDWSKNGQTLLLAVSDKCRFCSESAPFYQRLAQDHGKTSLVAVLPQPSDKGKGIWTASK